MTEKPRPVPNRTQLLPDRPGIPPMAELPVAERIRPAEIFAAYEAGEIDLICVLGPTASGKTRYAVQLARALNRLRGNGQPLDGRCAGAEILSGDSRQVYRGMDLGTGKDLEEYQEIPYHLIDIAEPDKMFVDVCRKFFPGNAVGLEDVRVRIYYEDGLRFLRRCKDKYDLIISDATDPLGHEAGLFTKEFYGNCYKALHDDGIMVYQHGSPFFDEDEENCRAMHRKAFRSFPITRVYQAHIPTCPAGYWLFGFASKKYHPLKDFDPERWEKRGIETWYYTTHLHQGAFMLPKYVEDIMKEEE